ncbi:hypothetical protein TrLO_g644 [Triparma laevis f. longispina]|uniref:Tyrosine-protein kinase ephrin type A/B receptor-like domain-containing protein n=1 Tax=Triparma laevis f. longispina TaxID=1714387 RepID=A0A9W7KUM1_9STRA|nr:hypothetical protein TrLO_g644 [Triparma laevis f. longispina]
MACSAGKFIRPGSTICVGCEAGKHVIDGATGDESSVCVDCNAGKYSDSTNSPTCTECSAGQYSGPTSSTCSECDEEKFSTASSSSCLDTCPGGTQILIGTACEFCPAGKFSTPDSSDCAYCTPEKTSFEGSANCNACSLYQSYNDDMEKCECADTLVLSDPNDKDSCTCSPGKAFMGSTGCELCEFGKWKTEFGGTSCTLCKVKGATTRNVGSKSSEDCLCPKGTYDNLKSECVDIVTERISEDTPGMTFASLFIVPGFCRTNSESDVEMTERDRDSEWKATEDENCEEYWYDEVSGRTTWSDKSERGQQAEGEPSAKRSGSVFKASNPLALFGKKRKKGEKGKKEGKT